MSLILPQLELLQSCHILIHYFSADPVTIVAPTRAGRGAVNSNINAYCMVTFSLIIFNTDVIPLQLAEELSILIYKGILYSHIFIDYF